jgi:hypothetical protein
LFLIFFEGSCKEITWKALNWRNFRPKLAFQLQKYFNITFQPKTRLKLLHTRLISINGSALRPKWPQHPQLQELKTHFGTRNPVKNRESQLGEKIFKLRNACATPHSSRTILREERLWPWEAPAQTLCQKVCFWSATSRLFFEFWRDVFRKGKMRCLKQEILECLKQRLKIKIFLGKKFEKI